MEDKYLEVRKENIFSKISNFFKNIFKKKVNVELHQQVEVTEEKENTEKVEVNSKENEEDRLLKLQNQFESNIIDISAISDEDLEALYSLYQKQNDELRKILADKLNQLEIIKNRIQNYKANM